MAVGQIIGRVSVKVLPDTTDFRRDAERRLAVIEKTLKMTVATRIDMSGASREYLEELRKINQRNRNLDTRKIRFHTTISSDGMREAISDAVRRLQEKADQRKITIRADLVAATAVLELDPDSLDRVRRELAEFRRRHDPLKIAVHPQMVVGSTTVIERRLEYLSRPRRVPLLPYVNSGAMARVVTALAALSGARVVSGYFQDMVRWIGRLDQSVPLIGSLALAIAGLAGWGLTAASNLFTLSAALASIAPAALALPGIFGGIAIGLLTTILALKDFTTVLPEVKTQFAALQDAISVNFWAVAAAPIRTLIGTLLPQLSAGLQQSATQLGGFFATLATSLTGAFNGALAGMFANLSASITIASTGTGALAGIIRTLGEVGAGFLPRLAQWFVDITTDLNTFLGTAAADGSLTAWINTGIAALADLGRVLIGVGRILAGIAAAAEAAGGSTLAILADTLGRVADVVNGPAFQTTLTDVLRSAHQAMDLIATGAGPGVLALFTALAASAQTILPIAGQAIGQLLGAVAGGLAQIGFQQGLVDMFAGLAVGAAALSRYLGPVGVALGSVGALIGVFAAQLGPSLGAALAAVADVVVQLVPALQPLVTLLGETLFAAIQAISPVLSVLAAAIGVIVVALTPLVGAILNLLMSAITPLLAALSQAISQALPALKEAFGELTVALAPLIVAVQGLLAWLSPVLIPALVLVASVIVNTLIVAIEAIALIFGGVIDVVMGLWNTFAGLFTGDWARMWDGIKQIFEGLWEIIKGLFVAVLANVIAVFGSFADQFGLSWSQTWNDLTSTFVKAWNAIRDFFVSAWTGIAAFAASSWAAMRHRWSAFLDVLTALPGAALQFIENVFSNAFDNLKAVTSAGWDAVKAFFVQGVRNVRDTVAELPGKARDALGNLGSVLLDAGRSLIEGFITGIKNMFGSVRSTLTELTGNLTDWKGPQAVDRALLTDAGRLVIDGFITGLESRYSAVRTSLRGLSNDIAAMTIDGPTISGVTAASAARQAREAANAVLGDNAGRVVKVLNYYAAPGSSISAEEDLFKAAGRARMVGW